jgi:hypothetical protein
VSMRAGPGSRALGGVLASAAPIGLPEFDVCFALRSPLLLPGSEITQCANSYSQSLAAKSATPPSANRTKP